MFYFEVWVADSHYRSEKPLTYSFDKDLSPLSVVTIPLRNRVVTGFVTRKVPRPSFEAKAIRHLLSKQPLPNHQLQLARWISQYYCGSFSEALRQFAPTKPTLRESKTIDTLPTDNESIRRFTEGALTADQRQAINRIHQGQRQTFLLHGDTGTGKTRVYLELAKEVLAKGRSVLLLVPEIALSSQMAAAAKSFLKTEVGVIHSQLTAAQRKKLWLAALESTEPMVVVGPRSALFTPLRDIGLIVLDEAHEPAYKQEQSPHYQAARVASKLAALTGAKVLLGTATPTVVDYHLASSLHSVARMTRLATGSRPAEVKIELVDIKNRGGFSTHPQLSDHLLATIKETLSGGQQALIYLNRRGSARLVMCNRCGWQLLCPHCAVPLVYHKDYHEARCHLCGFKQIPPLSCPECSSAEVVYKSAGTKAIAEALARIFPNYRLQRFDGDNSSEERLNKLYDEVISGKVQILVGTQLLAKGLDLPKLGMVGIISAETSLAFPDYTAEERAFQLLYQVIGRVGRGHGSGKVIVQAYHPKSMVIKTALSKDWKKFYEQTLAQRHRFGFPPFTHLLKLVCRRSGRISAQRAAENLKNKLAAQKLPVEIIGPTPCFYERRGNIYYWQLVVKARKRSDLTTLAKLVPSNWTIDIDPANLL